MATEEYLMYINGDWVKSASGETFEDYNPTDGSIFAIVQKGGREDAAKAIDAAYQAKDEWGEMSAIARAEYLYKLHDVLDARADEIKDVLVKEAGSIIKKAAFEIHFVLNMARSAAEEARRVTGETIPSEAGKVSFYIRQPVGVVAAISPWNVPFLLSMYKVLYGLAAGNTVVLKPSSDTPVIGLKIAELFEEVKLPRGVLNVITGPGSVIGEELTANPKVVRIDLTGDSATGRTVAEKAGRTLKRVTLELGGSDPLIILQDADMDHAVNAAIFGAFFHQGQVCMSAKRIIVEAPVVDEFTQKFVNRAKKLKVGDPSQLDTDIGPMINQAQLMTVHEQVQDAVNKGAKILCGGKYRVLFYEPTVLSSVTSDMRMFKEEVFGPARPIIPAADADEALKIANDTIYGLSAGIITRDVNKALDMARKLECGMVHINDSSLNDECNAPFGGVKYSGMGRVGGKHSTYGMTEIKWITIQPGKMEYAI